MLFAVLFTCLFDPQEIYFSTSKILPVRDEGEHKTNEGNAAPQDWHEADDALFSDRYHRMPPGHWQVEKSVDARGVEVLHCSSDCQFWLVFA